MARNILVVEDDNNISDLIRMYLDKEGFEVRIAADGGKAVEGRLTDKEQIGSWTRLVMEVVLND